MSMRQIKDLSPQEILDLLVDFAISVLEIEPTEANEKIVSEQLDRFLAGE